MPFFHGSLSFSDREIAELNRFSKTLQGCYERKKPFPKDLQQYLYNILRAQSMLTNFWQKIEEYPSGHYCLQLYCAHASLLKLPWQLAIDESRFPFTCITRTIIASEEPGKFTPVAGPLKVLVMISSPEKERADSRLSYEEEEMAILKSIGPLWEKGLVQVDFTQDGSLASLKQRLNEQYYHILYYSGHGIYDNGKGYLLLEDENTLERLLVEARDFSCALMEKLEHLPTLVILASCQTGQGHYDEGLRGVADELMHYKIPAVIGMAFSIIDKYATVFAEHLFKHLANRDNLPFAFTKAILATKQEEEKLQKKTSDPQPASQWLIPQLNLNYQVEYIVDWKAPSVAMSTTKKTTDLIGNIFSFFDHHKNYLFMGRRRETVRLYNELLNNEAVLLKGQGGVGKTAMAEHLVKRLQAHDGTYQCFAFNENSMGMVKMTEELLTYLENTHKNYDIRESIESKDKELYKINALLKEINKVCRPVWVFDNLESCQQGIEGEIKPEYQEWLEYINKFLVTVYPVVFTGRYPVKEIKKVYEISLNEVSYPDFYRKSLQLDFKKLPVSQEFSSLEQVVQLLHKTLGSNYRALECVNEIVNNDPARAVNLFIELKAYHQQFLLDGKGNSQKQLLNDVQEKLLQHSKKLVFSELIRLLTEDELHALQILAEFRIPVLSMALTMQREEEFSSKVFNRLRDLTLLEIVERADSVSTDGELSTYYYVTPLVKDWLEENELISTSFSNTNAGRYYEYVYKEITKKNYNELEEAFWHYGITMDVEKLNTIGNTLSSFYYTRSLFGEAKEFAEKVLERAKDKTDTKILTRLGLIEDLYGNYDKALEYNKQCLAIHQSIGDRKGEGNSLNNIGEIFKSRGDYGQALEYLQQSLAILQSIGDRAGEGTALNNISGIYKSRGDYGKALEYLEQSLVMIQTIGDRAGEGTILNNISQIYDARGDFDKAMEYLQQSLAIRQSIGDRTGEGITLNNISQIYKARGDYDEALEYLQQSLVIQQTIGDRSGEGTTLNNISQIYKTRGDYDKALEYLQQSLLIREAIGDRAGEGITLNNISQVYNTRGDHDKALEYLQQSLVIRQSIGDRAGEGSTLNNISQVYSTRGDYDKALEYLQQSLAIRQSIGDRAGEGTTLNNISLIYDARGDHNKALEYLQQSYEIRQSIGDRAGQGVTLHNMASIYYRKKDYSKYLELEWQAFKVFNSINHAEGIFYSGRDLGYTLCQLNDPECLKKGLQLLQKSHEIGMQAKFPGTDKIAQMIKDVSEPKDQV